MYKLKERLVPIYWPEDCKRIQRVMKEAYYLDISLSTAQWIWEDYSYRSAAGWLYLPDDDQDLVSILNTYVEEYDE